MASKKYEQLSNRLLFTALGLVIALAGSVIVVNRTTSWSLQAAGSEKLLCTNLAVSAQTGIAPLKISATVSGYSAKGAGIKGYKFSFGDGTADVIQSSASATHTFASPGNYRVTGYLMDKQGQTYTGVNCQKTVTVREGTLVVDKTYVAVTLDAKGATSGLIYGAGFTITSEGATGFQIKYNEPTQGQGFYESSGGMVTGRSSIVRTYVNANKGNGVYSGSAVVQFYKDGVWRDGPTVSYVITLIGVPGTLSVDKNLVEVTLSKGGMLSGLVYGPGFTITSQGATGFQIKYNEPTQGQGFETSSGGIASGSSVPIRTYINVNKPTGVYTGSAIVQYEKGGIWTDGPRVVYTITLVD